MNLTNEKQFVIDALQKKYSLKDNSFRKKLDELYEMFMFLRRVSIDRITANSMFLSLYLYTKTACHQIRVLKEVLEEPLIDPFCIPYEEYAEKFEALVEDYSWWHHIGVSTIAPLWDGCGLIENDNYECYFGVKKEVLFHDISIKDSQCEKINNAVNILLDNESNLLDAISSCLKILVEDLKYIERMVEDKRFGSPKFAEQLKKREDSYRKSNQYKEAIEELYNDIKNTKVDEDVQGLIYIKLNVYSNLKRNRLGLNKICENFNDSFKTELYGCPASLSQAELNEYLRLNSQYEVICRLVDYKIKWGMKDEQGLFVNKGTDYIINSLVPYLSEKIKFGSREMYAGLWQALIDLNLIRKNNTKSCVDWINGTFLKDAPSNSCKGGKIKSEKSLTKVVCDKSIYQTKEGKIKQFKDLTEDEISHLKYGKKILPIYKKSVVVLAKAFDINLKEEKFQFNITNFSESETILEKFPKDEKSLYILESFRVYEDFIHSKKVINK